MRVANRCLALVLAICPLTCVAGEELMMPLAEGTTWHYEMTRESSSTSLDLKDAKEKDRFPVSYRIGGTQNIDNKALLKLELYRDETLASTDLITVDQHGIICPVRIDEKGALIKLNPPQTMVASPLKTGTSWNFNGQIGDAKVSQHYEIAGEEDVAVAAGKFRAWRIHCEQTLPSTATIDRWFVSGTGFVKVLTKVRTPSGGVLQETSLELKQSPKFENRPEPKPIAGSVELSVGLSKQPVGPFATTFTADTPAIYARWQGHGLRAKAKIRAVWIAENVADVAADYEIDEASALAETPNSHGTFTLSSPDGGWAPGDYRVEFYIDEALADTAKLKITK
jgi:hypothetical protein